ncbi:ROK family protein [uncultured Thomasclavelia sp.]|uniref:ROK family protein n=1 Tax=uncultured Thomasclavelia sp. TaxID=3025759 RepID=UPI0025EB055D|nr:ROK family protein [uncultured Thomasclavelia sp.]
MTKVTELKDENIHRVRKCFYDGKIWTKNELAKQANLSLAATTNVLQWLLKNGEIKLTGQAKSTGGRKSKQYSLNVDFKHLGLIVLKRDQANYYFKIKSVDLLGKKVFENTVESQDGSLDDLCKAIDYLIDHDLKITTLVISLPGVSNEGKIDICDFELLANLDLKQVLDNKYHLAVIIENDVNVAGIGFSQSYPDCDYLAYMYQPRIKYIGCSMMINHQLCKGFSNFAGELRYLPFLSHEQQDRLLQQNPKELLIKQLVSLCCVINPEIVGISSDVITDLDNFNLDLYLSKEHQPQIIFVKKIDELIYRGLYVLGSELILKRLRNGEE